MTTVPLPPPRPLDPSLARTSAGSLPERLPPQNAEAEQALLGSVLLDRGVITRVAPLLEADHFYVPRHGVIYQAMRDLEQRGQPVDYLTLIDELERTRKLDQAGDVGFLSGLLGAVPTPIHAAQYAAIIVRCARLRRLISAAGRIAAIGFRAEADPEEALAESERLLYEAVGVSLPSEATPLKDLLGPYLDELATLGLDPSVAARSVVPTGFLDLDRRLGGGLGRGSLVLLAGRPSMGKTGLALHLALGAALKARARVLLFSLEMAARELVERLLASTSRLSLGRLKSQGNGNLSGEEEQRLGWAIGTLAGADLAIDPSGSLTISQLMARVRRAQARQPLDLVVIDHLQLVKGTRPDQPRVQELADISRALKELAKEINAPILALSQLNRAVEQRPSKIPQLADLRESGALEQDADVVMFLYRDEYYNPNDSDRPGIADLYLAKHRSGETGQVSFGFQPEIVAFTNLARSGQP